MAANDLPPVFKPYTQAQPLLLPPSVDELIAPNHPVRVVSEVIDGLDLSSIIANYEGGGASSYHPAMLLKLIVYGYLRNIYSTRKIEEAVAESVHFMWLAGGQRPDHNTLARFRSRRLKEEVEDVFRQVVELLVDHGHVSLEEAYIDGTKLEANAGRYTFVWGRSIKTNKARMRERLNELLEYADRVSEAEEKSAPLEFESITPDSVRETVEKINAKLKGHAVERKVRERLRHAEKHYPEALERYESQEEILGERNSYSKTDPDATFMRMKEDHKKNAQPKPAYNLQISTENRFVTHYSLHQNPSDTPTLIPHLKGFEQTHETLPRAVTADAGYGSLENYEYLESKKVEAYVKYPGFDAAHRRNKDAFNSQNWPYEEASQTLICPAGKRFVHLGPGDDGTERFVSPGCGDCPFRKQCCRGEADRCVELNPELIRYKRAARDRLCSEEGVRRRKRRGCECETVFGQVKHNKGFRRLLLRGLEKATVELGILFLAHNLATMAA